MKKYKCMNIGNCELANTQKIFEIAEGEELECPNCHCGSDMLVEVKPFNWKIIASIITSIAVIVGGACAFYFMPKSESAPTRIEIALNHTMKVLTVGKTDTLTATVTITPTPEEKGEDAAILWQSTNESCLIVENGIVRALQAGTAEVVAHVEGNDTLEAVCTYSITQPEDTTIYVEEIIIEDSVVTLGIGSKKKLSFSLLPENYTEEINITSSDESIAAVTQDGIIRGIKAGTATITVKSAEQEAEAKVKVMAKATDGGGAITKDMGYATYKGKFKNGKMEDTNARLTFKTRHVIESYDPKKRMAEAGDYVIGEFSEGHLVQGVWYGGDNVVKSSIIIGKR